MIKKTITLMLSYELVFGLTPVTDTQSYFYLINSINQTTQLIQGATQQIQTLGGIRTVMEDVKADINDAKSSLEGSMEALKAASKSLNSSFKNVELNSLFDLDAQRTTTSGTGIAYTDIANVIDNSFKKADEALITSMGGHAAYQKFLQNQYKLVSALKTNSIDDFKNALNNPASAAEMKKFQNDILLSDYIEKTKKIGTMGKQTLSAQMINKEWEKEFFPNEEQRQEREEDNKRLTELANYIEKAKDMKQSTKTTNMILFEILMLLNKEHKSALNYRNAMTSLYLRNGKSTKLVAELKRRQDQLAKAGVNVPTDIRNSPTRSLKGSNPYGTEWRPINE